MRRTVTTDLCQLSLLDLPEVQPEPKIDPAQEFVIDPYGNQLPVVLFRQSGGWVDGDCSPQALERLAETLLLDVSVYYYGPPVETIPEKDRWKREYGHSIDGWERHYYRCVASGIVDGKVWGAYIYESCLGDLTRKRCPYDREEDDS